MRFDGAKSRSLTKAYHHGDLRAALLTAGIQLLQEKGVDGFTLREVARRAGVSHGAPARHFKGLEDLLTELAAGAFEQLTATMDDEISKRQNDPLKAIGLGYIRFALESPDLFRLMFRAAKLDLNSQHLKEAKIPAIAKLSQALSDAYFSEHNQAIAEDTLAIRISVAWSSVHGYAAIRLDERSAQKILVDAESMLDALCPALLNR